MRGTAVTLSVLSAIGGFAAALLLFVLGLVNGLDNDKYGKVPLPGEGRVTLPQGDVTVYYEERFSAPDGLRSYRVTSLDTHRRVPSEPNGGSSYEVNSVNGMSIGRLTVPRAGEYAVSGRAQGTSLTQPALTFGPDFSIGALVIRCLVAIGVGLVLCLLFALMARMLRRRPTPGPVPEPHSAAPMAAWQMRAQQTPDPVEHPPEEPQAALAQLEEDRRMGRIREADYRTRRRQILDRI